MLPADGDNTRRSAVTLRAQCPYPYAHSARSSAAHGAPGAHSARQVHMAQLAQGHQRTFQRSPLCRPGAL